MQVKPCSKCKLEKELSEFHKAIRSNDGLKSACKECRNKDKILYNNEHKKERREYALKTKEHIIEYKKHYYEEHREKIREKGKIYYQENSEYIRNNVKLWRIQNPEKKRFSDRKRRAKKAEVQENYTKLDEQYTKDLFQHKCANCGSTENLNIDHHYPLSKGNALTRQNAVLLCRYCNCSKHDKLPEEFYDSNKLNYIQSLLV